MEEMSRPMEMGSGTGEEQVRMATGEAIRMVGKTTTVAPEVRTAVGTGKVTGTVALLTLVARQGPGGGTTTEMEATGHPGITTEAGDAETGERVRTAVAEVEEAQGLMPAEAGPRAETETETAVDPRLAGSHISRKELADRGWMGSPPVYRKEVDQSCRNPNLNLDGAMSTHDMCIIDVLESHSAIYVIFWHLEFQM